MEPLLDPHHWRIAAISARVGGVRFGVGMRVSAAILAIVLGGSAALAQGDPRANIGPVAEPAKPKAKAPHKKEVAKPKPDAEAKDAPAAKPKAKAAAAKPVKPATTGSAAAGNPSAKPSGLQDTYAAIPQADRVAIQNDLTWGGDFTGPIDGEFSERLVQAVKAYQTRHKNPVTGVMSAEERKALASAVEPRKQEVGWRLAEDLATGARVGLPGRLATKTTVLQNGTRWTSTQGQLQVETFRIDTGATLDAVFEQQKKQPRRRVESSALQADSFVISGMQGLKKMVVRGYARNGEVRGITILYDQAMEGTMDPLVAPMSSAFVPFATGFVAAGAAGPARRMVEYGTGVFVSSVGHVLTDRRLIDGCNVIALPGLGNAERVATDAGGELALLRLYGARNLTPIGMLGGAPGGTSVTLVGIADPQTQGGGAAISAVSAKLGATETSPLETPPAPGFSGAAALDAQGRFAGMAVVKAPLVAGPGGAPRAAIVPAERIRNFLEVNYIAPSSGTAGVEAAKLSVTRVICVRK
jgi:peptidoglycan hydrolase-like protein with peptidoglycan-binding domain